MNEEGPNIQWDQRHLYVFVKTSLPETIYKHATAERDTCWQQFGALAYVLPNTLR